MKLVLSRKGFDSGSGGCPSPILADGTMASLPIPEPLGALGGATPYDEIKLGGSTAGALARQLGIDDRVLADGAHLDPDLDPASVLRRRGWRPSFGQANAAAAHLANQGVGTGDVFIFWGLFRPTTGSGPSLAWRQGSRPLHAVFGWLEVGEVLRPGLDVVPEWALDHPHVACCDRTNNTLYVAGDDALVGSAPAGRLVYDQRRRLTCPDGPLSRWRLPAPCHPAISGASLIYHTDPGRWSADGPWTMLSTVRRGQEFVVEATPAWREWATVVLSP